MNLRIVYLVIAVLLLNSLLRAQQTDSTQWLSDSSRAIQFGVGDYLNVRAFDTKSISFKYHLSATRALRIGLSFSGSVDKSESHRTSFLNDSLISSTDRSNGPIHSVALELSVLHIWYFSTNSDVFLFLGAGPLVQYSRREYAGSSYSDLTTLWSTGVGATIGTEWFVHRRISLHAEYQASGQYTHTNNNSTNRNSNIQGDKIVDETSNNRWSITSQRVLFGISVYF